MQTATWACPVCGGRAFEGRFSVSSEGTEGGVDAAAFRPSSQRFGETVGRAVRCEACGHVSLLEVPADAAMSSAYADAADPVSVREESGQVETARRALGLVERHAPPGPVLDVGCWTGSFLVAARERGWSPAGIEPSRWAAARARERGLDVREGALDGIDENEGPYRLVVYCDVLEHLVDPGQALDVARGVLEPGGALFVTVPDAGSAMARLLGRRWWSVLPMHIQYFTRGSLTRLLDAHGFTVRYMGTHPKVFTARYYLERLAGYSPALERLAVGAANRLRLADRLIAPDFHDRIAAIATRV